MSASAMMQVVGEGERNEAMSNGSDRQGAFNDPRFWVSVTAILLTLSLAVLGMLVSQLATINSSLQSFIVMTTRQGADLDALKKQVSDQADQIKELRQTVDGNEKAQRDYNFKLGNDLTAIKAAGGTK